MEDFRPPAKPFRERRRTDRHNHKFLAGDVVVRVFAAVDDVHHRHGQHMRVCAANRAVQRQPQRLCSSTRRRQRHREDAVCAEIRLFGRAVKREHGKVDCALAGNVYAEQFGRDHLAHVPHGFQCAFTEVASLVAVAQFQRFVSAGGRAGRNSRPACHVPACHDLRFNGRVAARVQNFTRRNLCYRLFAHLQIASIS
ncbi:hypothetical protein SDC9_102664 [bioreactor metagenome]|uniref:Uncharacterized protein n=1 Tax=bioreactor metagenome TaxID=1076179 RepID=A0A645ASI7_9ZZZZ